MKTQCQRAGWAHLAFWACFLRSGGGTDHHCHHLLLPGAAGCSSGLRPRPRCSLEELLLLGPPYGALHLKGSRTSPWSRMQVGGRHTPARAIGCEAPSPSSFNVLKKLPVPQPLPPCSMQLPPSLLPFIILWLLLFPRRLSSFLHKYRDFKKTVLCCGLLWESEVGPQDQDQ